MATGVHEHGLCSSPFMITMAAYTIILTPFICYPPPPRVFVWYNNDWFLRAALVDSYDSKRCQLDMFPGKYEHTFVKPSAGKPLLTASQQTEKWNLRESSKHILASLSVAYRLTALLSLAKCWSTTWEKITISRIVWNSCYMPQKSGENAPSHQQQATRRWELPSRANKHGSWFSCRLAVERWDYRLKGW